MSNRWIVLGTLKRLPRLCLKELRESLRDRRTVVTLVLMPLLVYPLLSLVLNRVLLTSVNADNAKKVTIGLGAKIKDTPITSVLQLGYMLLADRSSSPTFLEPPLEDGQLRSVQDQSKSVLPQPSLSPLADSGAKALREGAIDVLIVGKSGMGEAPAVTPEQLKALEIAQSYSKLDTRIDFEFDPGEIASLVGRFEVRYRNGDPRSERALQLVERMLAVVNNISTRDLVSRNYAMPFQIDATPVVTKSNYSDLLATMVPLVLVLMTMAGAVYPAIDLTAGERERGTMEALIISPTPSYILLVAKYSAVVTVALLTALANLAAMTVTLWVSGIGQLVFGEGTLTPGVIGTVLVLLVLFTLFFAALLLAVTSFARSFKEAQAYLIPLMLLALTPGVMSLLPGIEFTNLLATVPLVNIVLLAREVLNGTADWNTAWVAVIFNLNYALAALAVAAYLFGTDAAMQGSRGSWHDMIHRPSRSQLFPRVDQMAMTMAVMFPFYFVASSALPSLSDELQTKLVLSAVVSFLLILFMPAIFCWLRRIQLFSTFRLAAGDARKWVLWLPGVVILGAFSWIIAHELFLGGQLVIGTLSEETLQRAAALRLQLQALPLWFVLAVLAITPAVCEELLFRGFVLNSLHRINVGWAIVVSAVMFGLMHVLTSNVLAVERFLPTTFMGLILGFVAIRTGSIWPGMILHALHNGLLLSINAFSDELEKLSFLIQEGEHLPTEWIVSAVMALAVGLGLIAWSGRGTPAKHSTSDADEAPVLVDSVDKLRVRE